MSFLIWFIWPHTHTHTPQFGRIVEQFDLHGHEIHPAEKWSHSWTRVSIKITEICSEVDNVRFQLKDRVFWASAFTPCHVSRFSYTIPRSSPQKSIKICHLKGSTSSPNAPSGIEAREASGGDACSLYHNHISLRMQQVKSALCCPVACLVARQPNRLTCNAKKRHLTRWGCSLYLTRMTSQIVNPTLLPR